MENGRTITELLTRNPDWIATLVPVRDGVIVAYKGVPKNKGKMGIMKCPRCKRTDHQHKIGKTAAGSKRYRCYLCGCKYTPIKKARGYSSEIRQKAVQLYVDGMNLRRIGRHLKVNPQSVANWVKAHSNRLPPAPVPEKVENAELDELFSFILEKKTESIS